MLTSNESNSRHNRQPSTDTRRSKRIFRTGQMVFGVRLAYRNRSRTLYSYGTHCRRTYFWNRTYCAEIRAQQLTEKIVRAAIRLHVRDFGEHRNPTFTQQVPQAGRYAEIITEILCIIVTLTLRAFSTCVCAVCRPV